VLTPAQQQSLNMTSGSSLALLSDSLMEAAQ